MDNEGYGVIKKRGKPRVTPRTMKNTHGKVIKPINWLPVEAPKYIKIFIEKYKAEPIAYISICRVPIPGAVEVAANLITLGGYEKEKANRNIDRFFHLFMIIGLEGGRRIIYEKNQRITLFETYKNIKSNEANCIPVPNATGILFGEFVENGIKTVGALNYFRYDALSNNCQSFVRANLQGSKLWNQHISNFVMQNVEQIVPSFVGKALKGATNLAAIAESITGFKPSKKWTGGEQIEDPILEARKQKEEAQNANRDNAQANTGSGFTPNRGWSEYMGYGVIQGYGVLNYGSNFLI